MDYLISSQEMQHDRDAINEGDVSTSNLRTMYDLARMAKNYCNPEGQESLNELLKILKWYMSQGEQDVTEGSHRVDSIVTDALRVMKGPEVSDAVLALKRVLGDRAYNERRGFYSFYIDQIHDMYSQQGVTEGWKDEADDFTGWSNYVKEKLSKAAPEQRLGIAKQLSQIEVKNFGSTIQGGFNRQTGKAQPGLGLTDTVRNIFKSFSQEQQDIHAYNTKDEDGKAGTPDAGKFATKFGSIFVYGMENATQIELVLMGKAVRMGPDYSKAAQEIYRKTGTLTVDDLKGIRKGFEDNANKFATSIGAQILPSNRPEEPTALTQASLAQQDQRLKENSISALGSIGNNEYKQWMEKIKKYYPTAKVQQRKSPPLLVIAYDKGKEVGVFDIENQEVKFVPPTPTSPQQSAIPAKPASALDRVRSRMDSNKGVAEGEKDTSRMNQQHQDFYNKNPNFKRDDREVKSVGGRLATKVTPKTAQVTKKPMTPFEGKIDFAKKLQGKVDKHNKAVVKTKQAVGSRVADIGAGGKEHNVDTDAAWDAAKKKVSEGYKKK
jgi:hypothetical protein